MLPERTKIRNNIAERLEHLKANVYRNPRPISYDDLPAIFVSSSHEDISLESHPLLFKRTLDVSIQGFFSGDINEEADLLIRNIENSLLSTSLELQDISFEFDSLGQDLVGSFIMNYQISYEEQK